MSMLALSHRLIDAQLPLSSIYLDPNNPRFVNSNWITVPDENIDNPTIQEQVRIRLIDNFSIEKLKMSMEVNGYLPIDRVIVREFKKDHYVTLEGNRRICAAKMIGTLAKDGSEISREVNESIANIPVLIYTGAESEAAWIFQGLRHISGIHDWSSFNKAKLLVEQMENEGLNLTEIGKRFGLTPHGAGQWVRGFYAFRQAREESDYILEISDRSYPFFQELFSRSSTLVREWLEWNDKDNKFNNLINFNEFVGWLYPKKNTSGEPEGEDSGLGDFDKRLIVKQDDIRTIAILMREEPDLFNQFRENGKLEEAYSHALARQYQKQAQEKIDPISELFKSIINCTKALENLPLKVIKDPQLKVKLDELIIDLEAKLAYIK